MHIAEKVHDILPAGEQGEMAEDDDTVETVIYECQQFASRKSRIALSLAVSPKAEIVPDHFQSIHAIGELVDRQLKKRRE